MPSPATAVSRNVRSLAMMFLTPVFDSRACCAEQIVQMGPVWQLVADRESGVSEAQLLVDYPSLRADDLVNARSYARSHRDEIQAEIRENEVA